MQMRKRVVSQKPRIQKIPPSLAKGSGYKGPYALLSAFQGCVGEVSNLHEHITHRMCYPLVQPLPLPPGRATAEARGGRSVTTKLRIFVYKPRQRPSELCLPDSQGFLKPTKCPCISFTSTGAISPAPTEGSCFV